MYSLFQVSLSLMSLNDYSLLCLLAPAIEQCQSIELMPLTLTDDYEVCCQYEENLYLCLNVLQMKSMVNLCYSLLFSGQFIEASQLNVITRVLLCYSSECLTSWNIRRRLILSKAMPISGEIRFSEILLRLKPKSEQLFRYRRWLLKQLDAREISLEKETDVLNRTAEKHFVNYASWQHRRWVVQYLNVNIDEELRRNRSWLEKNISDSSGFSFRAHLVSKKASQKNVLEEELAINETMIRFYLDRESLWIYRQTLIFLGMNVFNVDKQELLTQELNRLATFPQNCFTQRYARLIERLLSSEGRTFRD